MHAVLKACSNKKLLSACIVFSQCFFGFRLKWFYRDINIRQLENMWLVFPLSLLSQSSGCFRSWNVFYFNLRTVVLVLAAAIVVSAGRLDEENQSTVSSLVALLQDVFYDDFLHNTIVQTTDLRLYSNRLLFFFKKAFSWAEEIVLHLPLPKLFGFLWFIISNSFKVAKIKKCYYCASLKPSQKKLPFLKSNENVFWDAIKVKRPMFSLCPLRSSVT